MAPVLELLRAALGEPRLLRRTPELFAWKHFDNPFGRSIALLAEVDGRVVGLRVFMRWDLQTVQGETLRCVRAVDTATHPDFLRRGIFRRLTEEAVEVARSDDVDLVFNTPNQKSGEGYLSMGWIEVGKVRVLARPTRHLLARADLTESPAAPDRFVESPVPISSLSIEDRPPRGLRTPRTPAYLNWRFASHPTARYFRIDEEGSVAVVRPNIRNRRRELLIADVFGPRPSAAIRESVRRARASYIAAWFSEHSPERKASRRSGLTPVPVTALTLIARPLKSLGIDLSSMTTWDFAISDLELL